MPNNQSKVDPHLRVDYFENILTEQQAYFLGLLITDGYVSKDRLEINLNKRDEYIVTLLRDELGLSRALLPARKNTAVRFSVRCKKLVNDLAKWGVVPRKTFIAKAPNLSSDLQRHFWRGAIDGDGFISFPGNKLTLGLCGSYDMVQDFKSFTTPYLDKEYSMFPLRNIYYYRMHGENGYKILKYLYEGAAIFLPRKYERFLLVKAYFEHRKPLTSVYAGVSWDKGKGKFVSLCMLNGKTYRFGEFDSEIEAAKAYDNFVIEHNLNQKRLNFREGNR